MKAIYTQLTEAKQPYRIFLDLFLHKVYNNPKYTKPGTSGINWNFIIKWHQSRIIIPRYLKLYDIRKLQKYATICKKGSSYPKMKHKNNYQVHMHNQKYQKTIMGPHEYILNRTWRCESIMRQVISQKSIRTSLNYKSLLLMI